MSLPYLSMMRGDTTPFAFTVTNDGEPIDLTNCELTWTAKESWSDAQDADSTIVKTLDDGIEVVSASDGTIVIQMDSADTEGPGWTWGWEVWHRYVWDLQVLDDYEQLMTRGRGILTIYRDVTVTGA